MLMVRADKMPLPYFSEGSSSTAESGVRLSGVFLCGEV